MKIPSSIFNALLFTKEGCPPCGLVKQKITALKLREDTLPTVFYLNIKDKDLYPHLREEYGGVDLFPTLLLLNRDGEEVTRVVGGKKIFENLQSILQQIHENRV